MYLLSQRHAENEAEEDDLEAAHVSWDERDGRSRLLSSGAVPEPQGPRAGHRQAAVAGGAAGAADGAAAAAPCDGVCCACCARVVRLRSAACESVCCGHACWRPALRAVHLPP